MDAIDLGSQISGGQVTASDFHSLATKNDVESIVRGILEEKDWGTHSAASELVSRDVEILIGQLSQSGVELKEKALEEARLGNFEAASKLLAENARTLDSVNEEIANTYRQAAALSTNVYREIEYLERALQLSPNNYVDQIKLGLAYGAVGRLTEAKNIYEDARASAETKLSGQELASIQAVIEANIALIDMEEGRFEAALRKLNSALAHFEASDQMGYVANQYANICSALISADRAEQAVKPCEQALRMFSDFGDVNGFYVALTNLAAAEILLKDFNQATVYLESNLEHVKQHLPNKHPHVHLQAGDLMMSMAEFIEAEKHYGEAAILFENAGEYLNSSISYSFAFDASLQAHDPEACNYLRKASLLKPSWDLQREKLRTDLSASIESKVSAYCEHFFD